jgi:hypothetical protein
MASSPALLPPVFGAYIISKQRLAWALQTSLMSDASNIRLGHGTILMFSNLVSPMMTYDDIDF